MGAKKGRIEELPGARGARVSTQRSTLAREGKPNDYRDRVTLLPPRVSEQRLLGFQTGGSSPEKRLGLARCERAAQTSPDENGRVGHETEAREQSRQQVPAPSARPPVAAEAGACRLGDAVCGESPARAEEPIRS